MYSYIRIHPGERYPQPLSLLWLRGGSPSAGQAQKTANAVSIAMSSAEAGESTPESTVKRHKSALTAEKNAAKKSEHFVVIQSMLEYDM